MRLADIVRELDLKVLAGPALEKKVAGGYASDLLSIVMANAKENQLWITLQGHQNIIAVAVLVELAGVVIAGGVKPDPETEKKAKEEGINLFTTPLPVYELAGRLYKLGVSG
ncbi:MAG: serine kinase [Firmicutes bacterium]|nr:serine kinase [Bacillota bacterium]